MSTRRVRSKRLYQTPKPILPIVESGPAKDMAQDRTLGSGQVRTISSRTLKIIAIVAVILLVLWFTTPKPPALPGGKTQDMSTQTQKMIDLNTVKTTIPPVNTSTENGFGTTLKGKLDLK